MYWKYLIGCIVFVFVIKLIPVIKKEIRKRKYEKLLEKSGIRDIDKMDGFQFEVYLKVLFKKLGYKPEVTRKVGDYGADLVLKGKNRIVIQAKRYGIRNKVGISAVQEVYAAQAYYQGHEAWVITNSIFTIQAKNLAKACNVRLVDRYELQQMICKIQPDQTPKDIYENVDPQKRVCAICGDDMTVRVSKRNGNKFFGCSNFPYCKYTEPLNKEM